MNELFEFTLEKSYFTTWLRLYTRWSVISQNPRIVSDDPWRSIETFSKNFKISQGILYLVPAFFDSILESGFHNKEGQSPFAELLGLGSDEILH